MLNLTKPKEDTKINISLKLLNLSKEEATPLKTSPLPSVAGCSNVTIFIYTGTQFIGAGIYHCDKECNYVYCEWLTDRGCYIKDQISSMKAIVSQPVTYISGWSIATVYYVVYEWREAKEGLMGPFICACISQLMDGPKETRWISYDASRKQGQETQFWF